MADYSGAYSESILGAPQSSNVSSVFESAFPTIPVLGGDILTSEVMSPGTHGWGVITGKDSVGTMTPSFKDYWYNRIVLHPTVLNFGDVSSTKSDTVLVWNAYIDKSVICSSITNLNFNLDGVTVVGQTAPVNFNRLRHFIYTINTSTSGRALLDSYLYFLFDGEGLFTLHIIGTRLTMFPWRPQENIEEILTWAVEVIESRNGREQRLAIRSEPRQSLVFNVKLIGLRSKMLFDNKMFLWQKKAFAVPLWTEMTEDTSTISSGSTFIALDTANADYVAEGFVTIWASDTSYEVLQIDSVEAGGLNIKGVVSATYSGLKLMMPTIICKCTGLAQRDQPTDGSFNLLKLNFTSIRNHRISGYTPVTTYEGYEVITHPTTIENAFQLVSDAQLEVFDGVTGNQILSSPYVYNRYTQTHISVNENKAECWEFRRWLHSLNGMQKVFIVPTFVEDMTILTSIASDVTTFYVRNDNLSQDVGAQPFKEYLAFINRSTKTVDAVRRITAIGRVDDNSEYISIDSSVGQLMTNTTHMISFATKCRLSTPEVKMIWDRAFRNESKMILEHVEE